MQISSNLRTHRVTSLLQLALSIHSHGTRLLLVFRDNIFDTRNSRHCTVGAVVPWGPRFPPSCPAASAWARSGASCASWVRDPATRDIKYAHSETGSEAARAARQSRRASNYWWAALHCSTVKSLRLLRHPYRETRHRSVECIFCMLL